ncbi:MAG: dihydropteroate synthase [Paracoccaceae bacterium]|nr:dihydropteroate synthase [Paracoccaceae bacterium]
MTVLIVIGENINTTRRIRTNSKNIVHKDGRVFWRYPGLDGVEGFLDVTDQWPEEPEKVATGRIGHIGQGVRDQDLDFLTWAIVAQVNAGAGIIDLCVDELSVYPEERHEFMRWIVKTAQGICPDVSFAIDSSDPDTLRAGLEVYDMSLSRPAINSVSLEPGRDVVIDIAREAGAMIFANGSGEDGMPQDEHERVDNLTRLMAMMDEKDVPMEDRFLDPLVFPVGAGPEYGKHFLESVKTLRANYPDVHIFGGLSNVSFGLPRRKLLNDAFIRLSIEAGCDAVMIDPIMNPLPEIQAPPANEDEYGLAAAVMTAEDEYGLKYLKYIRSQK